MDGSFLTNEEVIEASRDFVCIRCATYEDAKEAEYLRWVFTRNDSLENTVFCMLSPDGKEKLIRANRGPMQFRRPSNMATKMDSIAAEYVGDAGEDNSLVAIPKMKDVRLGMNVAACERLPAILVMGQSDEQVAELEAKLSPVAWNEALQGMFIYFSATNKEEIEVIEQFNGEPGYVIIQPDPFGQTGEILAQYSANATADELKAALVELAETHERPIIDYQNHVRNGNRKGAIWETEIPIEDKGSLRAMERNRQPRRGR